MGYRMQIHYTILTISTEIILSRLWRVHFFIKKKITFKTYFTN